MKTLAKGGAVLCTLANCSLMLWFIVQCICMTLYWQDLSRYEYFGEANQIGCYVLNSVYIPLNIIGTILLITGSGPKIRKALKVVLMLAATFTLISFLSDILINYLYPHRIMWGISSVMHLITYTLLLVLGMIFCATGRKK